MVQSQYFKNTQFQSTCSVADQYTQFEGKFCAGTDIQQHTTLQAAKAACLDNTECGCIYDRYCDGGTWFTSKGSAMTPSPSGYCAWIGNC